MMDRARSTHKPFHPPAAGRSLRTVRPSLFCVLFLPALLLALFLISPAAAQQRPEMQVTVMSTGASRDTVAFGYVKDLPDEEIRKDFANFSQELGAKPPKLKITRKDGITVAEGKIRGLTDRTTGVIRLDALVQTCRRFGYFWVIYLFPGKAAPPQPVPLEHVRVESRVGGNVAYYQVWVDQSGGTAARLTPAVPPSPMNWRVLAAVTAIAVVVAAGMFLMVYVILGQRRASVAGKGKL